MRQLNYPISIPNASTALVGTGPQPQLVGYTHTNAGYQSVVVQGNYAYVAATGGNSTGVIGLSLVIYDVTNPAAPVYTGYLTTGTVPWVSGPPYYGNGNYIIAVNGNYLYLFSTGSSYLYIVNISNPTAPFNVSRLLITNTPGSLYGGAYQNGYVYIATQNKGLTVVNVSNPLSPTQVFQEGGTLNKSIGVFVSGSTVYTTNYQTTSPWTVRYLKIWNISTPSTPSLIETYTLPAGTKPGEVTVNGNYAYVSDLNTSTVQIVDITNPLAPNYLASMHASNSFNVTNTVAIDGNYAYITSGANATYGGSIDFFDITNKSSPVLVKTIQEGVATSLFTGSTLYNNLLYVADYGVSPSYAASLKIYSTQHAYSSVISAVNQFYTSLQLSVTSSSAAGTLTIQATNDIEGSDGVPGTPTNWNDITSVTTVSGAGIYFVPKTDLCYQGIRLSYVNTGVGGIPAELKLLGA